MHNKEQTSILATLPEEVIAQIGSKFPTSSDCKAFRRVAKFAARAMPTKWLLRQHDPHFLTLQNCGCEDFALRLISFRYKTERERAKEFTTLPEKNLRAHVDEAVKNGNVDQVNIDLAKVVLNRLKTDERKGLHRRNELLDILERIMKVANDKRDLCPESDTILDAFLESPLYARIIRASLRQYGHDLLLNTAKSDTSTVNLVHIQTYRQVTDTLIRLGYRFTPNDDDLIRHIIETCLLNKSCANSWAFLVFSVMKWSTGAIDRDFMLGLLEERTVESAFWKDRLDHWKAYFAKGDTMFYIVGGRRMWRLCGLAICGVSGILMVGR
ncbi:hypothetical protein HDV00_001347 [Rhizophlyctis rosea]|nr:hypothetical protein HDV00_001347 [Rhizophlyctis rosea]